MPKVRFPGYVAEEEDCCKTQQEGRARYLEEKSNLSNERRHLKRSLYAQRRYVFTECSVKWRKM